MPPHDRAALILADGMFEQDGENLDETLQLLVGKQLSQLECGCATLVADERAGRLILCHQRHGR